MFRSQKSSVAYKKAFTLVELMVSIAIFALMTALVMVKYSSFNSGVLLTNAAYDVALAIRTAQTYGLSVKSTDAGVLPGAYGIYFNLGNTSSSACVPKDSSNFVMYQRTSAGLSGSCDYASTVVATYSLKQGAVISSLCSGTSAADCEDYSDASIFFKRPDPDASIYTFCQAGATSCWQNHPGTNFSSAGSFIRITIKGSNDSTRFITVLNNGQISVSN